MTSWLNKQRKQTLLDLSQEAGLKQDEDSRKDELVENLDTYLQQNQTRLGKTTSFAPYFDTRRVSSKPAGVALTSDEGEGKALVKAKGRRTTKVKPDTDEEDAGNTSPSQAVVPASRTPARPRRRSELLPASPADVAEDVEIATKRAIASFNNLVNDLGVHEVVDNLRDTLSSLTAVHVTILAIEAYGLQRDILPWKYAFDIPSVHIGSISTPEIPIKLLDLFQLLTGEFWSATLLWGSTSIFLPLIFAYFYNLSARDVKRHGTRMTIDRHRFDPLVFNVAKAIITYVVYGHAKRYTFGLFNRTVAERVDHALVGGHQGVLIGSFVGIIASLYEAVQRK